MIKKFIFYFLLTTIVYAESISIVPISNKTIKFKSKVYNHNAHLVKVNNKYKCKEYLDLLTLKQNKYFAKHYIAKNKAICLKDVYIPKINKIKFRFGNLEIEREGKLIKETEDYIKIKNLDGTIEKIYIDGRKQ